MKEFWKDIRTEKGKYQVSSKGRVRSLDRWVNRKPSRIFRKGQILIPYPDKKGYLRVHLTGRKTESVHRLVAMAFVPNPHRYTEINHKDSNRQNNNVFNIEWCTRSYNNTREHRLNLISAPVYQYTLDGAFVKQYPSQIEAARQTGIPQGSISNCCNGKQKTAGDYIWRVNPI